MSQLNTDCAPQATVEYAIDMKAHPKRTVALVAALALAAVAPGRARAAPPWWNYDWQCRRPVTLPLTPPSGLAGADIACISLPTGGRTLPDAADVRVTTATRREIPARVLMTSPGVAVRVDFAVQRGVEEYYVH